MANHSNSHSVHHTKSVPPKAHSKAKVRIPSAKDVLRASRSVRKKIETGMEKHPVATVAAVGGAAFVVGAVFGSRLGRTVLMAAAPFVVRRVLETTIGQEIEEYVRPIFEQIMPDSAKN